MSGANTPPTPPEPSVRKAASDLLDALAGGSDRIAIAERVRLREALRRTRPDAVPNVATALEAIAAMKRFEMVDRAGIIAIIDLAEEGARQLDQFAARFEADRRAMAAWAEAHPDLELWVPEREDALVWLMELFDCSFDRPTIDQVDQVRARLKGAMLRAPNQLTKDAGETIDLLSDALRKAIRGKFIAEQRVAELERAVPGESALSDHLDALGLLREAVGQLEQDASAYADQDNGGGYRACSDLAGRIGEFLDSGDAPTIRAWDMAASPSGADALAYGMASPKVSKIMGGIEESAKPTVEHPEIKAGHAVRVDIDGQRFEGVAVEDGRAELRLVEDAEPIAFEHRETNRVGVVERTTIDRIYGGLDGGQTFSTEDHREDLRRMARDAVRDDVRPRGASDRAFDALVAEARKSGIVDDAAKTIWRQPGQAGKILATKLGQLTGYPIKDRTAPSGGDYVPCAEGKDDCPGGDACPLNDAEPIGGKNTVSYERRQMEERINTILQRQAISGPLDIGEIGDVVHRIAPGWEWAQVPPSDPPQIVLIRYAPGEPL